MSAEKFDAIVVGAGPAGSTAALIMARAGLNVLLVERGEYPGAKNMFGGVLYRWPLETVVPKFWETAPVERAVVEYRYMLLSENSGITLSYRDNSWGKPPHNTFTALRSKFDRWYAQQAEDAGATLLTSVTITDLIWEKGKVIGVRSNGGPADEAYADVVIGADGIKSEIASKVGLRPPIRPDMVTLGVKEVFELPSSEVESRFHVGRNEGVATLVLGVTRGKMGGGFIYTNKESLSVGLVISLSHLIQIGIEPWDLLDEFEHHPLIRPLLEDGKRKEYSAHMIPEAGYDAIPPLYTHGLLLAGDAAFLCDVQYFECTNLAMASGMLAAQTVIEAERKDDFSAKMLAHYQRQMESSYVMQELRARRRVPQLLTTNPRLFRDYPDLANLALRMFLTVDGVTKKEKRRRLLQSLRQRIGLARLLRDLVAARSMIP